MIRGTIQYYDGTAFDLALLDVEECCIDKRYDANGMGFITRDQLTLQVHDPNKTAFENFVGLGGFISLFDGEETCLALKWPIVPEECWHENETGTTGLVADDPLGRLKRLQADNEDVWPLEQVGDFLPSNLYMIRIEDLISQGLARVGVVETSFNWAGLELPAPETATLRTDPIPASELWIVRGWAQTYTDSFDSEQYVEQADQPFYGRTAFDVLGLVLQLFGAVVRITYNKNSEGTWQAVGEVLARQQLPRQSLSAPLHPEGGFWPSAGPYPTPFSERRVLVKPAKAYRTGGLPYYQGFRVLSSGAGYPFSKLNEDVEPTTPTLTKAERGFLGGPSDSVLELDNPLLKYVCFWYRFRVSSQTDRFWYPRTELAEAMAYAWQRHLGRPAIGETDPGEAGLPDGYDLGPWYGSGQIPGGMERVEIEIKDSSAHLYDLFEAVEMRGAASARLMPIEVRYYPYLGEAKLVLSGLNEWEDEYSGTLEIPELTDNPDLPAATGVPIVAVEVTDDGRVRVTWTPLRTVSAAVFPLTTIDEDGNAATITQAQGRNVSTYTVKRWVPSDDESDPPDLFPGGDATGGSWETVGSVDGDQVELYAAQARGVKRRYWVSAITAGLAANIEAGES